MEEKRILAIDYGLKRIGLALSDPLLIFAYPFETIQNTEKMYDELLKIISEKNVFKILLGYPTNDRGESSDFTKQVLKFKEELSKKTSIEIILRDERYTSIMAQENVLQSVTKKMKRRDKGLIDRNSAAIILQEFLDEYKK
ncbi:MAG TPA: Holliday junction resolvase RuvX [Ignavibacteriaceae bacterium]|nr:Holliday junction resolvase RuvX [Ignavibacteriaceae bacterium]